VKYFKIEIWKDDVITTFILPALDRPTVISIVCEAYPYHDSLYITELEV